MYNQNNIVNQNINFYDTKMDQNNNTKDMDELSKPEITFDQMIDSNESHEINNNDNTINSQ